MAVLILAVLLLLQLSSYSIQSGNLSLELAIVVIAAMGIAVGIFISRHHMSKPPTPSEEINFEKIKELKLTDREYQVLQKISEGLSNKEIGEHLYLSESTIKTHVSNLLVKLDAKRRTQALQIAKDHQII